jgi:hypothetical protein
MAMPKWLRFPVKKSAPAKRTIWEEILKRIFIYKNEVHFGTKEASVDGLAEIVHFFFTRLLKLTENLTLEELPETLEKKGYKKNITSRMESFVNELSHIKYAQQTIDNKKLDELISAFENIIYLLNKEQQQADQKTEKPFFLHPRPIITAMPPPPQEPVQVSYHEVAVSVPDSLSGVESHRTYEHIPAPKSQKISLATIEFSNLYESGMKAASEDRLDDARGAYEDLAKVFERLSKHEKKEMHEKLLTLYEEIIKR